MLTANHLLRRTKEKIMIINIHTDERSFYRKALRLLEPFPPFNRLRKRELDVLAELFYYNEVGKSVEYNKRMDMIFSRTVRLDIIKNLDISKDNLNNNLKELRKKGFIEEGNKLTKKLIVRPDHVRELIFRFQPESPSSGD